MQVEVPDYYKLAKSYLRKHETAIKYFDSEEDALMELVLEAIKQTPNYDKSRSKLSTFYYTIFKTVVLHQIQSKKYQKRANATTISSTYTFEDEEKDIYDTVPDDINTPEKLDREMLSKNIFKKLYPYFSDTLKKYICEDKSITQIAKEEGVTQVAIGVRIKIELERLKKALEDNNYKHIIKYREEVRSKFTNKKAVYYKDVFSKPIFNKGEITIDELQ